MTRTWKAPNQFPAWTLSQAEIRSRAVELLKSGWTKTALGLALGLTKRPGGDVLDKLVTGDDIIGPSEQVSMSRGILQIEAGRLVPKEVEYQWGNCRRTRQLPAYEEPKEKVKKPELRVKITKLGPLLRYELPAKRDNPFLK